jgi:hypothetical protein
LVTTTREAATRRETTRNYSKKTEYYDKDERGDVEKGEIKADGDEEETSSNQH